jgi:hypothetical protein
MIKATTGKGNLSGPCASSPQPHQHVKTKLSVELSLFPDKLHDALRMLILVRVVTSRNMERPLQSESRI